jgi:hypothetical protein
MQILGQASGFCLYCPYSVLNSEMRAAGTGPLRVKHNKRILLVSILEKVAEFIY